MLSIEGDTGPIYNTHTLVLPPSRYAFQLSHAISSAWETVIVKGEEDEEKASARLFLYERARDVLGGVMRLLSIGPLERM
jgi:arginyl-tRNA synthetase